MIATILTTVAILSGGAPHAESEHPNVVIILADDMGYGDPLCYNGVSKIRMPHIERLAQEGMQFTDAHAPGPLCHLSRYGLMTGRYPFRADIRPWRTRAIIEKGQMTIASLLRDHGYRTAMVGKWHLGFNENGYDRPLTGGPIDCGFDSYFGIRASTDIPPYFYIRNDRATAPPSGHIEANHSDDWSPIQGAFWRAGGIAPDLELPDVLPRFTAEATSVIENHSKAADGKPLLLYLAFPAPHTPWLPEEEFQDQSGAGLYGDFALMVDAMIGRVLAALDDANLTGETLVIFTSDNGPVWYDGDIERFGHDSAGGLRGMKADAWEAGHRMPFIVRWPGKVQSDSTSEQTICFTDLLATFASMLGVDLPREAGPDSFDFLPVLLGEQPDDSPVRRSLVMASGNGTMTIRVGRWKLITGLGSGGFSQPRRIEPVPDGPTGQLYDLQRDPAEQTNLFLEKPGTVEFLRRELERVTSASRSRR